MLLLKSWAVPQSIPCIHRHSSWLTFMLQGTEGAVQRCDTGFYGHRTQTGAVPTPHWGWLYTCMCAHTWLVMLLEREHETQQLFSGKCSEKENGNKEYLLLLSFSQENLQIVRCIFCSCSLVITLLTSVQFCQFKSAEMWPSACLKFIQTIHHSVSCRLCVL